MPSPWPPIRRQRTALWQMGRGFGSYSSVEMREADAAQTPARAGGSVSPVAKLSSSVNHKNHRSHFPVLPHSYTLQESGDVATQDRVREGQRLAPPVRREAEIVLAKTL